MLENEQDNGRFAPQSGHCASIDLNYRFVKRTFAIGVLFPTFAH